MEYLSKLEELTNTDEEGKSNFNLIVQKVGSMRNQVGTFTGNQIKNRVSIELIEYNKKGFKSKFTAQGGEFDTMETVAKQVYEQYLTLASDDNDSLDKMNERLD